MNRTGAVILRAFTTIMLAVLACSCSSPISTVSPAAAHTRSQSTGSPSASVSYHATALSTGLPNFHMVHPFLLRGAAPTPDGLRNLKAMHVKTVIDLRISPRDVKAEKALVEKLGMRFINLPMSGDSPTAAEVSTWLRTVQDPSAQPVFIHCQHGADRTGTMVGIYREKVDGWKFPETYKEMRKYGFNPVWFKLKDAVEKCAADGRK